MGTLSKLGKFYNRMLCKHPILVQGTQTGLLMGVADVIAQKVVDKREGWDYMRTAKFASIGLLAVGPSMTLWYKVLAKLVKGSGPSAAVKKMALDQLLFAPCSLAFFLVAMGTMQGKNWEEIKHELDCKYLEILKTNYKVWPAVQIANFAFVPLNFQVLLVQTVALFWNTYLSWKSQSTSGGKDVNLSPKVIPKPRPGKGADEC